MRGFDVTLLAARGRFGANRILPRRIGALVRTTTRLAADVGFGAAGAAADSFGDGVAVRQFAWTYRLAEEAGQWVLQAQRDGAWVDLYAFTLEPQLAVDFEVANHYVSTHPQSRFVQSLTAQRVEPEARHTLVNRDYSVDRGTETSRHTVRDDDELLELWPETSDSPSGGHAVSHAGVRPDAPDAMRPVFVTEARAIWTPPDRRPARARLSGPRARAPGSEARLARRAVRVTGDALDAASFVAAIPEQATVVHLVGTPHPNPSKAAEFQRGDARLDPGDAARRSARERAISSMLASRIPRR